MATLLSICCVESNTLFFPLYSDKMKCFALILTAGALISVAFGMPSSTKSSVDDQQSKWDGEDIKSMMEKLQKFDPTLNETTQVTLKTPESTQTYITEFPTTDASPESIELIISIAVLILMIPFALFLLLVCHKCKSTSNTRRTWNTGRTWYP